jgi:hypothetical protein
MENNKPAMERPGVVFTPEQERMIEEIENHESALALWVEWFKKGGDPTCADSLGDSYCFFCNAFDPERHAYSDPHREDCIYLRARQLIEKVTQ